MEVSQPMLSYVNQIGQSSSESSTNLMDAKFTKDTIS